MIWHTADVSEASAAPAPAADKTDKVDKTDMVGKALRLLTFLGDRPDGATLSELARAAGYPTSTAFRLLATLTRDGFVRLDERTKRYSLGLALYALGQRVSHAYGFAGTALPIMHRLSAQTREASLLSTLDGGRLLYVHYVDGPQQVSVVGEPGKHGPLHATSSGKVLIGFAPPRVRDDLLATLDLARYTPNTITDRERLRAEVDAARERGYASVDEEHELGVRAVSVPVLGPDGTALAALSTAAPAYRTPVDRLVGFVPELNRAAHELALRLPVRP